MNQIDEIVARYPSERGSLIPVLQALQGDFGYLSVEAIDRLSQLMGISVNEIYGVATFYTQFRFTSPGEHSIRVCQGTACHVRGGRGILEEVERHLGIKAGETTGDGKFDLERVACLGCCALAPVMEVDGEVYGQVTAKKISSILSQYSNEKETSKV